MLWYGTQSGRYGDRPEWTVLDGHPTPASCEAARDAALKDDLTGWQETSGGPFAVRKGNEIHFYNRKGDRGFTHIYSCLPDTVDPRGPKGK